MSVPVHWVVSLLVALEPSAPWRPTFEKTAEAIARVAESEPLFNTADGATAADAGRDHGEARTAALLVAVAWYESRLKPTAKSKDGQFVCLFQVDKRHLADPQKALDDPEVCTRAAIKILRSSLQSCAKRPFDERLAQFMSGSCDKGVADSRYRMFLGAKLLKEHPFPNSDNGGGTARAR